MPVTPDLVQRFKAEVVRLGLDPSREVLGLAVSGGSDSLALMYLAQRAGLRAQVATVDHGLRPEAEAEAETVAQQARALGFTHETLRWRGWDGQGNLQDHARRARRALLAEWARRQGLAAVALAHTQDDLAETLLMRLARGAGVDGLAAMQDSFAFGAARFLRPLLWASRSDLRALLAAQGAAWIDDPSNAADRFDRARIRKAQPMLGSLGLTRATLAEVAQNLAMARAALDSATTDLAQRVLRADSGILRLAPDRQAAPMELQRRLIQRVILWISPADYAPRGSALTSALARLGTGRAAQLAHCHFLPQGDALIAFREARAAGPAVPSDAVWDGVWQWRGDAPFGAEIRALGADGLAFWQDWRGAGLPRAALLCQPSLWQQGRLLSTPLWPQSPLPAQFIRNPAPDALFSMRLAD